MYHVLLADDEPSIIQSMKNAIAWDKYGMEVTYTASSGEEALNILMTNPPDIAILDIRMPGHNGLELSKYISQNELKTQVIIVSGYAEFSYAQKAIQYNVLGYCLKPVEYDEITSLLLRAVRNLESSSSFISASDFLEAIESNQVDMISHYLEENHFLYNNYYLASSISENPLPLADSLCFCTGTSQYGYLSHKPFLVSELEALSDNPAIRGIGIYPTSVSINDLHNSFYRCLAMGYHYFINPEMKVCTTYHDFHSLPHTSLIENAVNLAAKDKLISLLEQLMDREYHQLFSIHSAQQLYNMIISNSRLIPNSQDYYIHHYRQLTHEYSSFQTMLESLIQMLDTSPEPEETQEQISNSYFLKIMKYINTYYNENISLKDIAEVVNMNPNYISQVFKKSTGTTFSRYLTDLRINHAKKLLETTNTSINDISLQTGFNDYFYFLKTFKKYTGKTPSEYREIN